MIKMGARFSVASMSWRLDHRLTLWSANRMGIPGRQEKISAGGCIGIVVMAIGIAGGYIWVTTGGLCWLGWEAKATLQIVLPDDRRDIQGTWVPLMVEESGKPVRLDDAKLKIVFDGDQARFFGHKGLKAARFSLDTERRAVDLCPSEGGISAGIYRLEGKRLVICMAKPGAPRPRTFQSAGEHGCELVLLERR